LSWSFDGVPVFEFDLGGFGLHSTHRADEAILLFRAVEDCYGGRGRDAHIFLAAGRFNERQKTHA
jgi:hypothetical protein